MDNLKERLANGEAVHGCWLNLGSPISAEIIGGTGFDWVLFDLEHGAGSEAQLISELQALGSGSTVPIVRVESNERPRVQHALDAGAKGLMFPQIQRPDEAATAVSYMAYPPHGRRGFAKMVRATEYGSNYQQYQEFAENSLLGVIQIETMESLNHLEAIACLEGVDVLFVGPADLSLALGISGQWDHPDYIAAVTAISAAAHKAGKASGSLFFDPAQYEFYYQRGYRFLACGSDMSYLRQGAEAMADWLGEQRSKHRSD